MSKIWVTSDLHLGHDRQFIWGPRGFSSTEEMNETIIKNWNSIVAEDDEVYVLGDLMLGDNDAGSVALKQLKGVIHVVAGNHDTDARIELYKELGFSVDFALRMKYKGYHFYLSHYPTMTTNLGEKKLKQCTLGLYGHTHQQTNFYNDIPMYYHVGVDSHNCYPILLDNVIDEMYEKVEECKSFL